MRVSPALNMVGDACVKNFSLMRSYDSITRSIFACGANQAWMRSAQIEGKSRTLWIPTATRMRRC